MSYDSWYTYKSCLKTPRDTKNTKTWVGFHPFGPRSPLGPRARGEQGAARPAKQPGRRPQRRNPPYWFVNSPFVGLGALQ
jgi:hypothetical protein